MTPFNTQLAQAIGSCTGPTTMYCWCDSRWEWQRASRRTSQWRKEQIGDANTQVTKVAVRFDEKGLPGGTRVTRGENDRIAALSYPW